MPLSLKTHEATVNKQGETIGMRVTPYIRLCEGAGPPIFLQGGMYYYEGGEEVPKGELPEWVSGMMKKCAPDALRACGFKV